MKDAALSRTLRVKDKRTARAFADPLRRRLLLTFVGREQALAEVAHASRLDLKRLHYHVTALKKLGLVAVTRTQRRAGRPIKFYRAVADAFFVPAELETAPPHVRLTADLRTALNRAREASREGVLYDVDDNGIARMRMLGVPSSGSRTSAEIWRFVRLVPDDAPRLAAAMERIINTHASDRPGANAYLVHFAFAPVPIPVAKKPRR